MGGEIELKEGVFGFGWKPCEGYTCDTNDKVELRIKLLFLLSRVYEVCKELDRDDIDHLQNMILELFDDDRVADIFYDLLEELSGEVKG